MATLYELTDEYRMLLEMAEDPDIDLITLNDTLEGLTGEIEDKAEGYACVIKELEAEAGKFDAEITRLTLQRDRYNSQVKRMKETLMASMIAMGKTKIPTAHFKVSVANNGGLQPLFVEPDLTKVPEEYLIREPKADNKKIRDALAKGEELAFAHLEPRGQHLSIR